MIHNGTLYANACIAKDYRRASLQDTRLSLQQQVSLRVAARHLMGNVDSAQYDVIARLQLLESAAGLARPAPNAGTWWKMGTRGLSAAADHYAETDIDPAWLSKSNTGLIRIVYALVQRKFQQLFRSGGSFTSAEDIVQNGIMGLTKDGVGTLGTGPLFIHAGTMMNKGGYLYRNILSGKETPQRIAGVIGKSFAQKVLDEMRVGDRTTRRAPTETETGDSTLERLPTQTSGVEFWEYLVALLKSRSSLGRKLESKMRDLAGDRELVQTLIDRIVAGEHIGSLSRLHKDMGGSGSTSIIRWIQSTFIPAVAKLVQNDSDLLSSFRLTTNKLASQRKRSSLERTLLDSLVDRRGLMVISQAMAKTGDEQSVQLIREIQTHLLKRFEVDTNTEAAINRLADLAARGKNWDPALIRNNVFKVANSLGMRLPSSMFG